MKVVGRPRIEKFPSKHSDCIAEVAALLADLEQSTLRTPNDVREMYPSAKVLD
jgi:mRNA-degrading endonuclease HigB of HigAB toxin-antitoxin module